MSRIPIGVKGTGQKKPEFRTMWENEANIVRLEYNVKKVVEEASKVISKNNAERLFFGI